MYQKCIKIIENIGFLGDFDQLNWGFLVILTSYSTSGISPMGNPRTQWRFIAVEINYTHGGFSHKKIQKNSRCSLANVMPVTSSNPCGAPHWTLIPRDHHGPDWTSASTQTKIYQDHQESIGWNVLRRSISAGLLAKPRHRSLGLASYTKPRSMGFRAKLPNDVILEYGKKPFVPCSYFVQSLL